MVLATISLPPFCTIQICTLSQTKPASEIPQRSWPKAPKSSCQTALSM